MLESGGSKKKIQTSAAEIRGMNYEGGGGGGGGGGARARANTQVMIFIKHACICTELG